VGSAPPAPAGANAADATDAENPPASPATANSTPAAQPAPTANPKNAPAPAGTDAASNAPASGAPASDTPEKPDKNDQPAAVQPVAPPAPKPKHPAATPADPVVLAEKYIYGRGAPQNCDRGMNTLRPVAAKGNPKAMISLGALYSTGVCVPRDLPTAYHWFALALRKQPDDQPLQENMEKLWSEMTQPERQLAIRLSQ